MSVSDEKLLSMAKDVMVHAYCPYSKFPVGAALLTADDTVIVGVTQLEEPTTPCGMCRQFLIEFGDCRVIMGSSKSDKVNEASLADLLPDAFTPATLETHTEQSSNDD